MKKILPMFPVSVIVPMRNSSTTVIETLKSILKQNYPIEEVIIVDNASADDSVSRVKKFKQKLKFKCIRVIEQSVNHGVGASYNLGVKLAVSKYVVFIHSDSILLSKNQLTMLVAPIQTDSSIVATYSHVIVPLPIWQKYPFWEKCLLSTSVGKETAGLNGKFDCINKSIFESIGGFDEVQYGHDVFIGGEDGDLHVRLKKVGRVVCSQSHVIHLHTFDPSYGFFQWIANRKLLARSYGRFIRIQWRNLGFGSILFSVKPTLVLLSIIGPFPYNWIFIFIFAFISMKTMYLNSVSRQDIRILLLPFISIFLVYYETYWMIESFLLLVKK